MEKGLQPGRDHAGADRAKPRLESLEGEAGPARFLPPIDEREGDHRGDDAADDDVRTRDELDERIDARHDDGCRERRPGEEHERDEIPDRVDAEAEDATAEVSNTVSPLGQGRRDERGS